MSGDLDELCAAWSAGDLDADGLRRLEAALAADPVARERFARWCRTDVVLRAGLRLGKVTAAAPPDGPNRGRGHLRRGRGSRRPLRSHRSYLPLAGLAAIVALAVVLILAGPGERPASASPDVALLTVSLGTVTVDDRIAAVGAELSAGARIHAAEGMAVLRLSDGSEVDLGEGTTLVLDASGRLRLRAGAMTCRVAAQGAGRLLVDAPFVEAAVVGTVFSIEAGPDETLIQVDEGRVRVRPTAGGERVLGAGERAAVTIAGFRGDPRPAPISGFQVIDPRSDVPVGPVVPVGGRVEVPADLGGRINLRIDAGPEVASLRTTGGSRGQRLEAILPFSLFSDRDGDYDGQTLQPGDHVFRIRAYADTAGRQALGDPITVIIHVP